MKYIKKFNELFSYSDARKRGEKGRNQVNADELLIDVDQFLKIHDDIIDKYGGVYGIRDEDALESVILKPYMSAFGQYIYPTFFEKLSALFQAIVKNHPMADGNKRTGFYVVKWILNENGYVFDKSYSESIPVIIKIINGDMDIEDISNWLKNSSKK
jgi:death-on-curing protein